MRFNRSEKEGATRSLFISNNRKRLEALANKLEEVNSAIRAGELDTSSRNVGGESRTNTDAASRRET